MYNKTPIYRAPINCAPTTTNLDLLRPISSPQIGLNMHIVNKQNPDLPRMFPFPQNLQ